MKSIAQHQSTLIQSMLWVVLISLSIHCKDNKATELFEKPALERAREDMTLLQEKLKSSEYGWKAYYQPSTKETGFYQFVFHFLNDTEVEMASDFSSEDFVFKKSEYSILVGTTVKLSFSTFSPLHKLSDSDFSPISGQEGAGLKGDFEFLYYGENEQGDLVFRTNRTNETLLFQKATKNSLAGLSLSYSNLKKFSEGKSAYRLALESKEGRRFKSGISFPYNARVIQIRKVIKEEKNGQVEYSYDEGYMAGFGLTPDGVFLDSVKRNNGEFLKNVQLKYNEEENWFQTTLSDGTLLAIGDTGGPLMPVNGQLSFLDPTLTAALRFNYKYLFTNDFTTPAFNAFIEKIIPAGFKGDFGLLRQFLYEGARIDYTPILGTASVTNGNVRVLLIYEDRGDRLVIKQNGFRDSSSAVKPASQPQFEMFMNFLTDPQGFYVENLGQATILQYDVFTFTSVKDPSMRFALYRETP